MIKQEELIFRDAALADLNTIVDIYNSTIPGRMVTADTEKVTVESKMEWFRQHFAANRPLWVVTLNNQICGWLSFQSFYGRPAYNATAEVSIYIAEEFRGQGLGRIMLQKAIDACPKLGVKTLLGFIFGHNEPSLQLFYRFGFTEWGLLPKVAELDGIERDLAILGKRIF